MRISVLSAALLASNVAMAATPINGWYTSVFGGYSYLPDNMDHSDPISNVLRNGAKFTSGYNAGGRIGYQSNPLRYEGEYTYVHASAKDFNYNLIPRDFVSGFTSANLIMANVYYDFPDMLPAINPYLGLGIGYAYLRAKIASDDLLGFTSIDINANAFAYQGTAGLTYNFAENYAVNIAYRYAATDKTDEFGKIYQMHMASIGAVYRFDCGTYQ